jgi:hypothetical protein
MQKILELTGFEMQGDFLTDIRYLTEIVPIVTNEPKHSDAWNADQVFEARKVGSSQTILSGATDKITFATEVTDPSGNYANPDYTVPASGKYTMSVTYLVTQGLSAPQPVLRVIAEDTNGNRIELAEISTPYSMVLPATINLKEVTLNQGDIVYVEVQAGGANATFNSSLFDGVFKCTEVIDTTIGYTNLFECTGNMPEMTLKEFVKSLAQRYNLLFKADVVSQVITVLTYDEVYNATPLDWTDRLDVGGRKIDFHPAFFGQNNQFRWADETNNPVDYANGQLLISDEILSKAIVSIQQPFAASLDVIRFDNVSVSQIPLLEYDEISVSSGDAPAIAAANQVIIYNVTPNILNTLGFQTSAVYKLTTVKPRLLYVDLTVMSDELVYDDGTNTAQDANAEPLTWFWNDSAYNLTFVENENGLIDNYISLAFSFGRFKKLTVLMNLTAIDALTFAFDRTITINPYGRF